MCEMMKCHKCGEYLENCACEKEPRLSGTLDSSGWVSRNSVNRKTYQEMVDQDIEWLNQQPMTLERQHIRLILADIVDMTYGKPNRDISGKKSTYDLV